jgi:hypothetical protein
MGSDGAATAWVGWAFPANPSALMTRGSQCGWRTARDVARDDVVAEVEREARSETGCWSRAWSTSSATAPRVNGALWCTSRSPRARSPSCSTASEATLHSGNRDVESPGQQSPSRKIAAWSGSTLMERTQLDVVQLSTVKIPSLHRLAAWLHLCYAGLRLTRRTIRLKTATT